MQREREPDRDIKVVIALGAIQGVVRCDAEEGELSGLISHVVLDATATDEAMRFDDGWELEALDIGFQL